MWECLLHATRDMDRLSIPFFSFPRYDRLHLLSIAMLPAATIADKTAADYFVHSLPGAPEPLLKMHAGYVPIVFDTKMGLC